MSELPVPALSEFHQKITDVGHFFLDNPEILLEAPVPTHHFAKGLYSRQLTMSAGSYVLTRVHRHDNFAFIVQGDCTVYSEDGENYYSAPCMLKTLAGTQRAISVHNQCTWVTVHSLPPGMDENTDIAEVEHYFACDTYEEYQQLQLETGGTQEVLS